MKIIDVGEDRFLVVRELSADEVQAKRIHKRMGGTLIRSPHGFLLCEKITEADFDEVEQTDPTQTD